MSSKEAKMSTRGRPTSRKEIKEKEKVRSKSAGKLSSDRKPSKTRKNKSPARSPTKVDKAKSPKRGVKASKSEATPKKPAVKTPPRSPVKKSSSKASPIRQSPARRSPGRPKSVARKEKEPVLKIKRIVAPVINLDSDSEDSDTATTSSIETRSRLNKSKEPSIEIINNLRSRVQRDVVDRVVHLPSYESVRRINEFSDDDDIVISKPKLPSNQGKVNHGKTVIVLLQILLELFIVFGIPLICSDSQCDYRWLTRKDIDKVLTSFDLSILLAFIAFILFNGIISILPIGGRKYSSMGSFGGKFDYILNGLLALIVQVAILVALEVYHIPVTMFILKNYFNFITASVVVSLVLGVILFVKSFYARDDNLNTEYNTNSHVVNFIMGGEVNPRFGPMDVKFVIIRCCIIASVLLSLCHVYQSMEMISTPPIDRKAMPNATIWTITLIQSLRIQPTLFVLVTLIVVYMTDQFFFESAQLSMMEFKTEAFGFLKLVEYLAGIFFYCFTVKYVYDYHIELAGWELGLCTAVFLVGYFLYRGSNSQKHAFKENPYSPLVAKFDSIPTTTGRKILCSGYWGFVRHPNYLGDILLTLAMIRFVWPSPIACVLAFIICNLAMRAVSDNRKCKQRYGIAWERYCQRVPYLLIPKVF